MLPEGTISSDAIGSDLVLYNDIGMHTLVSIKQKRGIFGQQTLVDANAGDIQCVRSSDRTQYRDTSIECGIRASSYSCTTVKFGWQQSVIE